MTKGRILNIQRMSTEDGPGIRTTVFFKGCPLACGWCHNPESIDPGAQVVWQDWRCIGCGACAEACPEGALGESPRPPASACTACGTCVEVCPAGARDRLGTRRAVEALVTELCKDRAYFEASGGGVTLSGGEPTLQGRFARALVEALVEAGLPVALDTCGLCPGETLLDLADKVDLVLFDLKAIDSDLHRQHTGQPNERILANIRALAGAPEAAPVWVRTPLIPGATDSDDNIEAIGTFLAGLASDRILRWELCAFNNLCREQYARLGQEWAYADAELLDLAHVDRLVDIARSAGAGIPAVVATGATRRIA